jgi:hypothetical protein
MRRLNGTTSEDFEHRLRTLENMMRV